MKRIQVLLISVLLLAAAGCKKSSGSKPVCHLSVVTPETGDVINLYYDDQGRLSKLKTFDLTIQYEYKADSIIATERKNLGFFQRKRYKLNAEGLPLTMKLDINESGSQWWRYDYEYKGTDMVKSVWTIYGSTISSTIAYSWNNGNLTGFQYGIYSWKFDYYDDKLRLPGDGFHMAMLSPTNSMTMMSLYGAIEVVRNKNLLKRIEQTVEGYGTGVSTFEYGFDKEGKIEKVQVMRNNGEKDILYEHQYHCN